MLKSVLNWFSSLTFRKQDGNSRTSRKRQLERDFDSTVFEQAAKRCKSDSSNPVAAHTGSKHSSAFTIADWFRKKKSSFTQSYFIRDDEDTTKCDREKEKWRRKYDKQNHKARISSRVGGEDDILDVINVEQHDEGVSQKDLPIFKQPHIPKMGEGPARSTKINRQHESKVLPQAGVPHSHWYSAQSQSGHRLLSRHKGYTVQDSIRLEERRHYERLLRQWSRPQSSDETSTTLNNKTSLQQNGLDTSQRSSSYFCQQPIDLDKIESIVRKIHPEESSPDVEITRIEPVQKRHVTQTVKTRHDKNDVSVKRVTVRPTPKLAAIVNFHKKDGQLKQPDFSEESPTITKVTTLRPRSPSSEELRQNLELSPYAREEWLENIKSQERTEKRQARQTIKECEMKLKHFQEQRDVQDIFLEKSIRERLKLSEREAPVLEEDYEEEKEVSDEFPELTPEMENLIDNALVPYPQEEILAEGFRLQIARKDIETLGGLNWLNDEVINFYMNLIMDRSKLDNYPNVHAFNTFFYPTICSRGQAGVKRWTKKIDIFSMDFVIVPVHLGMHWCLAVVDFQNKQINYYDSMGGNNMSCLQQIKKYLCDESLDKRKETFNTEDWKLVSMKNIPQQMNGSDCGMFACKFAEYTSRRAAFTFSQEHMPYFRRRMIYEIVTKKLL